MNVFPRGKTVRRTTAFISLLTFLAVPAFVFAQDNSADSQKSATQSTPSGDYQIGPGDVLAITVSDAPEYSGKYRVNHSGFLEMTAFPSPVQAQGKTPAQLSVDLAKALEDAKLYINPTVNIFVEEYHSRTVTVVGAVAKPSIYPLQKRTTVLEIISQAGGLLPTAGNRLTIVSPVTGHDDSASPATTTRAFDLGKLERGAEPGSNVEVHDGDVVSVSLAEVVYVVGAVTKPAGFALPDQSSGMTALQAIAMAGGMTSVAGSHNGLIIRRSADGTAQESLPIDIAKLLQGKTPDVFLKGNDILFVPISGAKQTLHAMGEVAMSALNGIAIYGVGYRAAGI